MLDDLAGLLAAISGGSSREESYAYRFLGCLFLTVCAGVGCLLFLIFAGHGFYSGDAIPTVTSDLKIAALLALVTTVFGYLTRRWLREDTSKKVSE